MKRSIVDYGGREKRLDYFQQRESIQRRLDKKPRKEIKRRRDQEERKPRKKRCGDPWWIKVEAISRTGG